MRDYKGTRIADESHYYRWLKNLLLTIGVAMIAISLLPIPLGNASSKSLSGKTLEIAPVSPQQLENRLQQASLPDAALPSSPKKWDYDGQIQLELDSVLKSESKIADPIPPPSIQRTATVKKGDSLSVIFDRLGLPQSQLHHIINAGENARRLEDLRPGHTLEFEIAKNSAIEKIVYRFGHETALEVALGKDGKRYGVQMIAEDLDHHVTLAMGTITQSLFLDGQRAGLSDKIIMQLVGIFAWDVDFALNVRSGDQFSVIYEQIYKKGEKIRDGNILAAEFVNQGKVFRAVRYKNDQGKAEYYTPDGHNMRKAFLRTPVEFTRISSRFQLRRWHPVLHRFRAHRGVDYAAPRGTPVKVTANGRVTFVGRKGQLGKAILVQHIGKYTTVYGHLNKYARGIKSGISVRQGQIIGYVGSTGLATGPHLHYEFRINGVHKDPLKVKLPQAQSIAARYRPDFQRKTQKLLAQLNVLSRTKLASR